MSSKSATFLVIFIVAIIAFCLASVFAAMTGPISILPFENNSDNTSDDVSTVSVDSGSDNDYYYQDYDYSESQSSSPYVETTTDSSSQGDSDSPAIDKGNSSGLN